MSLEPEETILRARIELRQWERSIVWVTTPRCEEWTELFAFYSDELSFFAAEFEGRSVADGRRLFYKKDVEYLQSP